MGAMGDGSPKARQQRRDAYRARKTKEGGTSHPLLNGSVDKLIKEQMGTQARQATFPDTRLPYTVNKFTVVRKEALQYTWTLKATHETLGQVYMTGLCSSVLECVKAMGYCVSKGDWRLDRF